MSELLAAITPVVTATPVPTPQVVHEVVTKFVTPPEVVQLLQLLGLVVGSAATSVVHQLVDHGRFSGNFNRLLLSAYSTAAALLYLWLTGGWDFKLDDLVVGVSALLTALGTASGRYELWKFTTNLMKPKEPAETVVTEPAPVVE